MLAQLTTLKARLKIEEFDTADDALLTIFLNAMSGRFQKECNRKFDRAEDATYEFRADEMDILVDRPPIEDVVSFHLKSNEADGWVLQSDIVYLLGPQKNIIELATPLGTSREIARVTFDGGYVLPGGTVDTGQTALPGEIESACIEQCAHWYQNRDRLGIASVSGQGGSLALSVVTPLSLLPQVMAVIKKYERYRM